MGHQADSPHALWEYRYGAGIAHMMCLSSTSVRNKSLYSLLALPLPFGGDGKRVRPPVDWFGRCQLLARLWQL